MRAQSNHTLQAVTHAEYKFHSVTQTLVTGITTDLLARELVAWGGRALGTIGRDTATLLREDWMGRKEPLPARARTPPVVSLYSNNAPCLTGLLRATFTG